MKKRIFAGFYAMLFVLCSLLFFLSPLSVQAEEKTGYWLFTGAEKEDTSENVYVDEIVDVECETDYGGVKVTMTYGEEYGGIKKGTKRTVISSWTAPESRYEEGDTVSMKASFSCKDNSQEKAYFPTGNFTACVTYDGYSTDYISNAEGYSYFEVGEDGSDSYSEDITCTLKAGNEEGDKMVIEISCTGGRVTYSYKWIDTTPRVMCRWNLKDTRTEGAKIEMVTWNNWGSDAWEVDDPNKTQNAKTRTIYEAEPGSFSKNYTALESLYSATLGLLEVPAGFSATSTCTYTEPKDCYYAGDIMELSLTANGVYTTVECDFDDKSWTMDASINAYVTYMSAVSLDDAKDNSSGNSHYYLEYEEGEETVRSSKEAHSDTKTVSIELEGASYYDAESEYQNYMVLKVNSFDSMTVLYIYQWEPYESENPDSGVGNEIPVPGGSGFTGGNDDGGSPSDWINSVVEKNAENTPGEDAGIVIPIAIGAVAALGAAGAIGATESGSGKKKKKKKKPSTYKMYVYKDFGDSIRKGDEPKYVYARIGEITPEGNEVDRPDLSERIRISPVTDGFHVTEYGMSGNYKCAYVSADETFAGEDGAVSFVFTFEGGSFTENLWFRIVGDPYIEFPDQDRVAITHVVNGILGDNGTYEVLFNLKDFMELVDPSNVQIHLLSNDLILSCEQLPGTLIDTQPYKVIIKNRSPKNNKKRRDTIQIEVNQGKEKAENFFYFDLYPEGISAEVINRDDAMKDDSLIVDTLEDKNAGDMEYKILPVVVQLTCAYTDEDGKAIIDHKGMEPSEKFDSTTGGTFVLLDRWKYRIVPEKEEEGIYAIYPEETLALHQDPPTRVQWHIIYRNNMHMFLNDLPVLLTGDVLDAKKHDTREKELKLLNRAIGRYGFVGENAMGMDEAVRAVFANQSVGAGQIKQLRANLVLAAIEYYEKESETWQTRASMLSVAYYTSATVDWIGQQAFSYVLKAFVGDIGEMLITPLKNYFVTCFADILNEKIWGLPPKDHITWANTYKVIEEMAENFIVDAIFGDLTFDDISSTGKTFWKKVKKFDYSKININSIRGTMAKMFGFDMKNRLQKGCCFVVAFSMLNFFKHYAADEEDKAHGDIGLSLVATLNDCTLTVFKQTFSKYASKWLGNVFTHPNGDTITYQQRFIDIIKAHISFEGMTMSNRCRLKIWKWELEPKNINILEKGYDMMPMKDDLEKLIGQGVDATTGVIIDGAQALMGIALSSDPGQGFVISLGELVWCLAFEGIKEFLYDIMDNIYDFGESVLQELVPLVNWIVPKPKEEVEDDMKRLRYFNDLGEKRTENEPY